MPMGDRYEKTRTLKSRPKPQRAIIADILLNADAPLSRDAIVAEAKKANYKTTFPIEESVDWHLDLMVKDRTVKKA